MNIKCITILLLSSTGVFTLRILAIISTPTKSHHIWISSLTVALANRGHEVMFVTPHELVEQVPNLNVSVLESPSPDINKIGDEMIQSFRDKKSSFQQVHYYYRHNLAKCESHYDRQPLKSLIEPQSGVKFDLILFDYGMEDCIFGLIYRFGYAPMILLAPLTYNAHWALRLMDTPIYHAVPHWLNLYPTPMGLWGRISTLFITLYDDYLYYTWFLGENDRILRKYFGEEVPSIRELQEHVALLLVNQHSTEYRVPIGVNVIPVGGMHLKPASDLSIELKEFLDDAEDGAVLMSFGARERSDKAGGLDAEAIMAMFARLPQRIVWKRGTGANPRPGEDVVGNVMIRPWLPQNDVLGHPNVRLFISHCGGLSTQEATYHGVPVLAIPFLIDQLTNAAALAAKGAARVLLPEEINENTLYDSITEILNSPKYAAAARRSSAIYRTEVAPPLDRAVFWVEAVGRFGGAMSSRSPSRDLVWRHALLLDVVIATVASVAVILGLLAILVWMCRRPFRKRAFSDDKKRL